VARPRLRAMEPNAEARRVCVWERREVRTGFRQVEKASRARLPKVGWSLSVARLVVTSDIQGSKACSMSLLRPDESGRVI
jgi:hypothetical protein